jgi:hypothetical protein
VSTSSRPAGNLAQVAESLQTLRATGEAHPRVPEGDVEQVFALRWAVASEEMARALSRLSNELSEQARLYKENALAWREKAIGRRR